VLLLLIIIITTDRYKSSTVLTFEQGFFSVQLCKVNAFVQRKNADCEYLATSDLISN